MIAFPKVESLQPMNGYQVRNESNEAFECANLQVNSCAKRSPCFKCFDFTLLGSLEERECGNWRLLEREREAQLWRERRSAHLLCFLCIE